MSYSELLDSAKEKIIDHSSQAWTDFNTHDPGITILEYLCYTLSELNLIASMPIQDLLARPGQDKGDDDIDDKVLYTAGRPLTILGLEKNEVDTDQFYAAEEILPANALTELDYRKILIDIPGVRNAWVKALPSQDGILGLFEAHIEKEHSFDESKDKAILHEAWLKLQKERNLGEDFLYPKIVEVEEVVIELELEVNRDTDLVLFGADVVACIDQEISPDIIFRSLKEMLDSGTVMEDCFLGPRLKSGFLKDDDVLSAELKSHIHSSDLINKLMDFTEIQKVISLNLKVDNDQSEDNYGVKITHGKSVRFRVDQSSIIINQDGHIHKLNMYDLNNELAALKNIRLSRSFDEFELTPQVLRGRYKDFANYETMQNHFPEIYGIGQIGLGSSATNERKAQARQLKSYLLIFEQFMADYVGSIGNLKQLFSFDRINATFFAKNIENLKDKKDLLVSPDNFLKKLQSLIESPEVFNKRRQSFLDHLLARFAEDLSQLDLINKDLDPIHADKNSITDKERILTNYVKVSRDRGKGWNYHNRLQSDDNVSGLELRLRSLFGMDRDGGLSDLDNLFERTSEINTQNGMKEYRFYLRDGETVLLSALRHFHTKVEMQRSMEECCDFGIASENFESFQIEHGQNKGKYSYRLLDNNGSPIAESGQLYASVEEKNLAIRKSVEFLKTRPDVEHIILVDHLLLRSRTAEDTKPLSISNGLFENPYNFQVSVIFPGWSERCKNPVFRKALEDAVRMYCPAHIFPYIYFLDKSDMQTFLKVYKQWQKDFVEDGQNLVASREKLLSLIEVAG